MATKNKAPNIRILTIRDQKVVLDVDLARVYVVTTNALNQALRRNKRRFPRDFAFWQLKNTILCGHRLCPDPGRPK